MIDAMADQSAASLPACPRCQSEQREEQEQTGSSARWFVCLRCGHPYTTPRQQPR